MYALLRNLEENSKFGFVEMTMKITVINGTEQQGVTYRLKESFLQEFGDTAEVTEFYLPVMK